MNSELVNKYIDKIKNYFVSFNGYFDLPTRIFGVYLIWIIAHYVASHLYVKWCVQSSFIGLLMSPFLVPAPHCQGLRWAVVNGATNINAMWLVLSTWIVAKIIPFRNLLNIEKDKEQ
jgi:hypothetical protein